MLKITFLYNLIKDHNNKGFIHEEIEFYHCEVGISSNYKIGYNQFLLF